MRRSAVVGIGQTKYSKRAQDQSIDGLVREAAIAALTDAGMTFADVDAVVIGDVPHVYYFSAFRPFWLHQAALVLFADGRSLLVSPNSPPTKSSRTRRTATARWCRNSPLPSRSK